MSRAVSRAVSGAERSSEGRARQVSCLALQVFFEFGEAHGVPRAEILPALTVSEAYLADHSNWLELEALRAIERRMAELFPHVPDLFFQIGLSTGGNRSLGFLRVVSRALLSPIVVYDRIPGLMRRFLFRFFSARFRRVSWNTIEGRYRFAEGCAPTDAFLETARGVLSGVPLMLGAPAAEVAFRRTGDLEYVCEIKVSQWPGPVGYVRGLLHDTRRTLSLRLQAPREAAVELEQANRLLQSKVEELSRAKEELDLRVRDLAELRDSLAERVRERTSDLEIASARLEETVRQLERSDRAKSDFFTNVSHELRTPLTLILAPIDEIETSLRARGETVELARLQSIRRNSLALLHLVNEILDFSKLDAGRMPVRPTHFDLVPAIKEVLQTVVDLAVARGIALQPLAGPDSLEIVADLALLKRVVLNLVVNALKYARPGDAAGVRLRAEADQILLSVWDTGPGIAAQSREQVFERFHRSVGVDGREIEGSGIGLAMVRDIVTLHGGEISLEATDGGGATFVVRLPAVFRVDNAQVTARSDAAHPQALGAPAQPQASPEAQARTAAAVAAWPTNALEPGLVDAGQDAEDPAGVVLIAEDNVEMRAFLSRIVRRRYRVIEAQDGMQALEVARTERPDLVLSDVMMPRMNGHELCRHIKADPRLRNIPVLLITARHGPDAAVEGLNAGADDWVAKPFAPRELLARIDTQLRVRHLTIGLIRAEKQSSLGIMSSGIAHEVLNPVNAVVNSAPLVRRYLQAAAPTTVDGIDAEVCGQLIDAIETAGKRIEGTVRSILTFTRQGQGELSLREARPQDGIEALLTILGHRLGRHVEVVRTYRATEPVLCYPELLDQAVSNLVINALDSLPERGGRVEITVERSATHLQVRVKDDGHGVPAALRERIFSPFFTTRPQGKGTGLGLAITCEIMALHGGRVALLPGDGQGAEFMLEIPLVPPKRQPDHGLPNRGGQQETP